MNKNLQLKIESKKDILVSGSNYQNIVPNVGVRIQEEDKSKTGGLDFKNQFGRMSMKEYELLKQKYTQNNDRNYKNDIYNYDSNYNNINKIEENEKWKRSQTFEKRNYQKIKDNNKEVHETNNQIINNLYLNSNNYHIHNIGLKHYDWGSDEKKPIPEFNGGNKILNENLFKRNIKKKHSIYRVHFSDKNVNYKINKEKDGKDINYFNNQILQNKNWGNTNNSYKVGRTNFSNSIKKSDGINMRTRKKI